jgi:hypothetical protein
MLSPLQEQVAEIIAGLEEATDFALAGGAALISRGDVQRQTKDLDFFGLTTDASIDFCRQWNEPCRRSGSPFVVSRTTPASPVFSSRAETTGRRSTWPRMQGCSP